MSTAIDMSGMFSWDGDAPEDAVPDRGPELDAWLDSRLAVIAGLQAEQRQNTAVADRRKAMVEDWMQEQNASLQKRIDYLSDVLRVIARTYPYARGKTRKLPCGEIGLRQTRAKLEVVDKDAALAFARAHEIPVQIKESVTVTALKEYAESTGTAPDGCEYEPGGVDEPFCKAKEVDDGR